jgi:hypothetical protein
MSGGFTKHEIGMIFGGLLIAGVLVMMLTGYSIRVLSLKTPTVLLRGLAASSPNRRFNPNEAAQILIVFCPGLAPTVHCLGQAHRSTCSG